MARASRFKPGFRRKATEDQGPSVAMTGMPTEISSNEKNPTVSGTDDTISPDTGHGDEAAEQPEKDLVPTEGAQRGVQQVEAVALTWTKPYLIMVFIL